MVPLSFREISERLKTIDFPPVDKLSESGRAELFLPVLLHFI